MIFPSYEFLLAFLPLVFVLWWKLPSYRSRLIMLTLASYFFYGWWDWRFVSLMLGSTLVDYEAGRRIYQADSNKQRKAWLMASLVVNLGALGVFKYCDFFLGSAQVLLVKLGFDPHIELLNIILPVGISFYTFQSMSYSLDIYRRQSAPARGFLEFAAYVAMFPQLVAGPIVRYAEVETQLRTIDERGRDDNQIAEGVWLFVMGMAKKVWIADFMAPFANRTFDTTAAPLFCASWVGTIAYTLQLYYDFSGYSDMARGLGKMLGFNFPINFNSPYKSRNISEFWNRWHITLSHWLRDYLFIPLGGSRHGFALTLRNLVITMFLGGLWHGAAWTFVFWGMFHGGLLAVRAVYAHLGGKKLPTLIAVSMTMLSVMIGWVFFRAPSFGRAKLVIKGMLGMNGVEERWLLGVFGLHWSLALLMAAAFGVAMFGPNSEEIKIRKTWWAGAIAAGIVVATLFRLSKPTPFLYFQF